MSIPAKLKTLLDDQRVPYQVIPHPYAVTAQRAAQVEHVPGKTHAKVVMVDAGGKLVMTVCAACCRLDLVKLGTVLGKPVRLARETEFKGSFPDCETGAMPPFGELYGVPVYVDKSLTENPELVFEAGSHTDAVRMKYADFERIVHPQVAEFACHL
jgi:Ala-tRNA(Pro) deacylase